MNTARSKPNNRLALFALIAAVLALLCAMTACHPNRVAGIDYEPKPPCTSGRVYLPNSYLTVCADSLTIIIRQP